MLLKDVRKALETPLFTAMAAASVQVQWENLSLVTSSLPEYVRFSFHPSQTIAATLGTTPRVQKDGLIKTDIFVQLGAGSDRADDIFELIRSAYPVTTDLTKNVSQVQIGAIADNPGVEFGAWFYKPVSIPWTCWNFNG